MITYLLIFSIVNGHTIWIWHREILDIPTMSTIKYFEGKNDHLKEMICVVDNIRYSNYVNNKIF